MIIDLTNESKILDDNIILGDVKKYNITSNISSFNDNLNYLVNGIMNINYFIEGKPENHGYVVTIKNLTKPHYYNNITHKTNEYKNISLEVGIYIISSESYYRIFSNSETMIKGELNGNINIKDCGTNNSSLVVKCFRFEDNHFIGEYPIVNGVYNIPNLDVNTYYNLILEDKNRIIEQQVLSYRKPTAY